jgi:hypothetical protein
MKRSFFVVLFFLLGCKSLYPSHIAVFSGGVDQEYRVLGPVETVWREPVWTYPGTLFPWQPQIYYDEVNMGLADVAYTLFGDNVDAIINVEYRIQTAHRGRYRQAVCYAEGMAIQYADSPQVPLDHHVTYMYGRGAPRIVTSSQP